jgi:outer membrane immunogenic protein
MKKIVYAALALAASAATASAADLPMKAAPMAVAPIYNWSGFYIGVNAGGVWGDVNATETGVPGGSAYNGIGNSWGNSPSGFVAGGQAGYNWQGVGSPFVVGIEGDLGYLDMSGRAVSPLALTQGSATQVSTSGNLYGTIRGRVGYAFSTVMIYATGGAIFADLKGQITDPLFVPPLAPSATTGWQTGWTVGGGVEVGIGNNWSVKGEYLYFDLGTKNVFAAHPGVDIGHAWDISATGNIGRVGLNYRFGGPIVAKY